MLLLREPISVSGLGHMQDFSTEFFILWKVLVGSYLVSKSLTSLCLLTTVYS